MNIQTEYHTTQKTLFRRVNQIRKANGVCNFEEEGNGYRLHYCESGDIGNLYGVQGENQDVSMLTVSHDGTLETHVENRKTIETDDRPASELTMDDQEPGIFKLLSRLYEHHDLKAALEKIQLVAEYGNKKTENSIRTHHVMRLPGARIRHILPQLRFGGRWMQRAGFDTGQQIKIVTTDGMILIVPICPPEPDKTL